MRLFATAFPGFGALVAREVGSHRVESDGRFDVVLLDGNGPIRSAEDTFVEISHVRAGASVRDLATRLWDACEVERALSVKASRPGFVLRGAMTFRVIVRVRSERHFQRRELRDALTATISASRRRWRVGDPAQLEFWALESSPGTFRCGLRLTGRECRIAERPGALRRSMAEAMVGLAGRAVPVCDPCCGSGTIIGAAGRGIGFDRDPSAIRTAAANVPDGRFVVADAHRLPLEPSSVSCIVSNLPWGHRFDTLPPAALLEFVRVVAPGGSIVLLAAPAFRPRDVETVERLNVAVLGRRAVLWHLRVS